MERVITCFTPRLGTVFLCCFGLSLPVLASPPSKVLPPDRPVMATDNFRSGSERHSTIAAGTSRSIRLDLRPPVAGELVAPTAGRPVSGTMADEDAPRPFPSAHRGGGGSEDQNSLQAPGIAAGHAQTMGRTEAFVRRFHREGLPVARLWENHSALLSLGLNQKGKPGLWLVQKTH
jgi:hypothetical protein